MVLFDRGVELVRVGLRDMDPAATFLGNDPDIDSVLDIPDVGLPGIDGFDSLEEVRLDSLEAGHLDNGHHLVVEKVFDILDQGIRVLPMTTMDVVVSSSDFPQLVSERPELHLIRSVPVHRDGGGDGGVTLRPPLSDFLNCQKGRLLRPRCFTVERLI